MLPPRWSGSESPVLCRSHCAHPRSHQELGRSLQTRSQPWKVKERRWPAGKERRSGGGMCSWAPALSERLWENICFQHAESSVNWLWMQHAQKKQEGFVVFCMNQIQKQLLEK